jgi:hypothetical protein|nr:MAG TPA: hypothetical protein [Caudoviricetes sp.]
MERLTTNKSVAEMSMIELAHNSCYADDERNARYRDYNLDVDSRWLVRNLAKDICGEDFKDLSDEEVDEYMASMLSVGIDSTIGLLALFYRNLWAMADLREKLKYYEDAEEQGLLIRLPCKVGDHIYIIKPYGIEEASITGISEADDIDCFCFEVYIDPDYHEIIALEEFNDTWFLSREEAEAKLKEEDAQLKN